jgi:hypothetical protein
MKILLLTAVYMMLRLAATETVAEAFAVPIVFCLAMLGATRLAHVHGWRDFIDWIRKHPGDGLMTIGLSALAPVLFAHAQRVSVWRALLDAPVIFAWFWVFTAFGTNRQERRLKKAVEAELGRRAEVESRRDAL